MKFETIFLRFMTFLVGLPALAVGTFLLPKIAKEAIQEAAGGATMGYIIVGTLLLIYLSIIPFYLILFHFTRILVYIERDLVFSELCLHAFQKIKRYSFIISGLYVLALPFMYFIAEWDDAPGLILINVVITAAFIGLESIAFIVQNIIKKVVDKNQEETKQ